MSFPSVLKSLTIAAAVAFTGSAAFAQAAGTTGMPQKQDNSATPAPPSGTSKTPEQRTSEKSSTSSMAKDGSPTASKQNDSKTPLPESKTGGKTTMQRDTDTMKK